MYRQGMPCLQSKKINAEAQRRGDVTLRLRASAFFISQSTTLTYVLKGHALSPI